MKENCCASTNNCNTRIWTQIYSTYVCIPSILALWGRPTDVDMDVTGKPFRGINVIWTKPFEDGGFLCWPPQIPLWFVVVLLCWMGIHNLDSYKICWTKGKKPLYGRTPSGKKPNWWERFRFLTFKTQIPQFELAVFGWEHTDSGVENDPPTPIWTFGICKVSNPFEPRCYWCSPFSSENEWEMYSEGGTQIGIQPEWLKPDLKNLW